MTFLACCFLFATSSAQADIKLKMVVENSSETEEKLPVKSYLPKGIKPEDITDKGNFEISYDFGKSLYYAYQEITLKPKESVTLEITMKDIWLIPSEDIKILKDHTLNIVSSLRKTDYSDQAKSLGDGINKRLDAILEGQKTEDADVEKRFSEYEANTASLKEAKKDIATLEDIAVEAGTFSGKEAFGESLDQLAGSGSRKTRSDLEKLGTVKFQIEVSNPSDEKKTIPLKYYLPAEVNPEYIIDSGGLDVGYDYQKGERYVYKDAIDLAPQEKKEYLVEVKDIWTIPEENVEVLKDRAQGFVNALSASDYKEIAEALGNKIISGLDGILAAQKNPSVDVEKHIGEYRAALLKLEEAKKDTSRLEKMVIQAGGLPGFTLSGDRAGGKMKRGAEGLKLVGKSIFRGKAPNIATTWKLIYSIIGFLAVSSLLFIVLQFQQRRSVMFDALTGAFRREYILERLKEEFIIVQKAGNKCSILLADIDKFKSINDTYGHGAGDTVIKEFIIAIRQGIRNADFIGRLGGDEFLIVLSYADKERAQLIAEKIKRIVFEHAVKLKDTTLGMSVSIGVATYPDDGRAVKELLEKADKAMYKVKAEGGNGVA